MSCGSAWSCCPWSAARPSAAAGLHGAFLAPDGPCQLSPTLAESLKPGLIPISECAAAMGKKMVPVLPGLVLSACMPHVWTPPLLPGYHGLLERVHYCEVQGSFPALVPVREKEVH